MLEALRICFCLAFATALAVRGVRKRSLSHSGAAAAFVLGMIHFYYGLQPSVLLVLFYQSASQLTKFKAEIKSKIEHDFREGGQRGATQVLACCLGGAVLCFALAATDNVAVQRCLRSALLAHYAAACSDTWSSELGILSTGQPRFILTGKVVPKGTNGGVSALGTAAGLAGGLFMAFTFPV
ncbi:hypothetical protein WJX73_001783 [Symbiochloris irregularis]|uniref:Transmembrane protein 19 n=1 Tax=Symbiochloris irregularis TaxID=706552 RepID=A0AAW1PYZ2_9CHLO